MISCLRALWHRHCIRQRLRWAEGDLAFLARQTAHDTERLAHLRGHIADLRVQQAATYTRHVHMRCAR